jgi:uncharacterized membrane protein
MTTTSTPVSRGQRFWEVDCLRGLAIIMMVIYHLMWDLSYVGVTDVNVFEGFWLGFQRATASLFLLLVGVSLQLSGARARLTHRSQAAVWRRQLRRGLTVFAWGMVVTLATWLLLRDAFVRFGILHLIGLSMLLAYPFLRLGPWNLALGAGLIAAGRLLQEVTVDAPWLLWLGLRPQNFYTVDYFPLLPWFGVVLIGLAVGDLVYRDDTRRLALPDLSALPPVSLVSWLGRHSLAIYLLHQPLLIALLIALGLVDVRSLLSP